jgi:hypothetical protein
VYNFILIQHVFFSSSCFSGQVDFYINHHLFWGMFCIFSKPSLKLIFSYMIHSFLYLYQCLNLFLIYIFYLLVISIAMTSSDRCSPCMGVTNIIRKLVVTGLVM